MLPQQNFNADRSLPLSSNFVDIEADIVYRRLAPICGLPLDRCSVQSKFTGVALMNDKGKQAIAALKSPALMTINNVPVDPRSNCHEVFLHSLTRPGREERLDLLCCVATPGYGKSVLLCFNAHWFVEEKRGIAVVISFKDDQEFLWKGNNNQGVTCNLEFEQAVATRILHRILQWFNVLDDKTRSIEPLCR